MEVVASLSQGRTAAAQCGLFTHKSVPFIFEPPCIMDCGWMWHTIYIWKKSLHLGSLKERDHLGHLDIDGSIITT